VSLRELAPVFGHHHVRRRTAGKDQSTCEDHDFQILQKPFLANEIMNQIRGRLISDSAVANLQ